MNRRLTESYHFCPQTQLEHQLKFDVCCIQIVTLTLVKLACNGINGVKDTIVINNLKSFGISDVVKT